MGRIGLVGDREARTGGFPSRGMGHKRTHLRSLFHGRITCEPAAMCCDGFFWGLSDSFTSFTSFLVDFPLSTMTALLIVALGIARKRSIMEDGMLFVSCVSPFTGESHTCEVKCFLRMQSAKKSVDFQR